MIKQLLKLGYRKISWFVSGEQINYLPKPKAAPILYEPERTSILKTIF